MKIDQSVQEIWCGHESVTNRQTGHSYTPHFTSCWWILEVFSEHMRPIAYIFSMKQCLTTEILPTVALWSK